MPGRAHGRLRPLPVMGMASEAATILLRLAGLAGPVLKKRSTERPVNNWDRLSRVSGTKRPAQQKVIGRSTPCTRDHASLIARSTGSSFPFYAKLESARYAQHATAKHFVLTGDT